MIDWYLSRNLENKLKQKRIDALKDLLLQIQEEFAEK